MRFFKSVKSMLGGTPLVDMSCLFGGKVKVLGKLEGLNPSGSVKFRTAVAMIEDAEKRGVLKRSRGVVEPTSGNTGIALACVCAVKGYEIRLVMPESASEERIKFMKLFGADVVLTGADQGMSGAIKVAREIASKHGFFMPDQFSNPANPAVHEMTTGVEIYSDTDGMVDVVVAGVGTGGTITGIARYLKSVKPEVRVIAVEPAASPVISCFREGKEVIVGSHSIEGIGAGFIPPVLDVSLIDDVERVEDGEALEFSRRAARVCGFHVGISSGAALAGVSHILSKGVSGVVVVILPDMADRYLSTALFP